MESPIENNNDNNSNNNSKEETQRLNELPTIGKRQAAKGEKTICCWNCLSILMVRTEWSVVQCTTCEKLNRVPGDEKSGSNLIRLNDNLNHFDLKVPYVYGVITCPFCQTENKFRRDADHVVCFKCHNSYMLEESVRNNVINTSNQNNSCSNVNINGEYNSNSAIKVDGSSKFIRFSDMYSPDPMFYRGYYPQPYYFNQCDCNGTNKVLKEMLKFVKKKPVPPPMRIPDRYGPLRQLVRDVDEIEERRLYRNGRIMFPGDGTLETYKRNLYGDVYGSSKNYNPYPESNNRLAMSYNHDNRGDAIYKTLFTPQPRSNNNNRYGYY